jgi:hypothetical protein
VDGTFRFCRRFIPLICCGSPTRSASHGGTCCLYGKHSTRISSASPWFDKHIGIAMSAAGYTSPSPLRNNEKICLPWQVQRRFFSGYVKIKHVVYAVVSTVSLVLST